jgi:hypothetical protein
MEATTETRIPTALKLEADESPTLGQLAKALAAAQGEMPTAVKNSDNPDFNSRYADLAAVVEACRAALSKHGIAYLQPVGTVPEGVLVTTMLVHESGEFIRSRAVFPVAKKNPQAYGSAITYLRRYALAALVGVAAEDDDGAAASEPAESERQRARRSTAQPGDADPHKARRAKLWKAAQGLEMDDQQFRAYAQGILGHEKQSTEWTAKEIIRLEGALRRLKDERSKLGGSSDAAVA